MFQMLPADGAGSEVSGGVGHERAAAVEGLPAHPAAEAGRLTGPQRTRAVLLLLGDLVRIVKSWFCGPVLLTVFSLTLGFWRRTCSSAHLQLRLRLCFNLKSWKTHIWCPICTDGVDQPGHLDLVLPGHLDLVLLRHLDLVLLGNLDLVLPGNLNLVLLGHLDLVLRAGFNPGGGLQRVWKDHLIYLFCI